MARENKDPIVRGNHSQAELPHNFESENTSTLAKEVSGLINENSNANSNTDPPLSRLSRGVRPKLSTLEIPRRSDVSVILGRQACPLTCYFEPPDSLSDGYETAEESSMDEEVFMVSKSNLFVGGQEDENDPIPREKIMKRINSHKGMKSYQLACQLSTRWTTGAGPRIGCMRDYPPELQFRILEQQNMSPRTRTIARNPYPRVPSVSRFGQTS